MHPWGQACVEDRRAQSLVHVTGERYPVLMVGRIRGMAMAVQSAGLEVMVLLGVVMVRRKVGRGAEDGAPGRKDAAEDGGSGETA